MHILEYTGDANVYATLGHQMLWSKLYCWCLRNRMSFFKVQWPQTRCNDDRGNKAWGSWERHWLARDQEEIMVKLEVIIRTHRTHFGVYRRKSSQSDELNAVLALQWSDAHNVKGNISLCSPNYLFMALTPDIQLPFYTHTRISPSNQTHVTT